MLVYVLCAIVLVLAFLWWSTSQFKGLEGIPGPRPLPLLGNLLDGLSRSQTELHAHLMRQYGEISRIYMGARPLVLLGEPNIIHEVTVTAADKFPNRIVSRTAVRKSVGLLQARDEYWKRLRRTISPTFNVMHLKHMLPPMHEEAQVLLSILDEACEAKREVDIHSLFTRLTLDIIGRVAFGTKLHAQTDNDSEFLHTIGWIFRNTPRNNGAFSMLFPTLWEMKQQLFPSKFRQEVIKAQETLDEMSLSLIRQRKRERDEAQAGQHTASERVPNDFLDLLLDARDKATGQGLTEEEIRDQANTFLLAGHETTANAMAYTIFLIAQHPDVDQSLFAELSKLLTSDQENVLDLNQISSMKRLEMALKESLRMYPPATMTIREANEDVFIGGEAKYFIPKGTAVAIPIKAMNNSPAYWPEPERFLPFERWGDDDGDKKHSLVWLPFGAGPRNCIGMRFALVEAKLILAHVLRRFRFQLSPGQVPLELQPGITTSPKHGIRVTLHRRE